MLRDTGMPVNDRSMLVESGRPRGALTGRAPDGLRAERDEHQRDAELEEIGEPLRQFRAERDHDGAHRDERGRVTESPADAKEHGADRSPLAGDERRHGGEMIGFERVAHAEDRAERRSSRELEQWHNTERRYYT